MRNRNSTRSSRSGHVALVAALLIGTLLSGCAEDPSQRQVNVTIGDVRTDQEVAWTEVEVRNRSDRPLTINADKQWHAGPDESRVKVNAYLGDEDVWKRTLESGDSRDGPEALTVAPRKSSNVVLWHKDKEAFESSGSPVSELFYNDVEGSGGHWFYAADTDSRDDPEGGSLGSFALSFILPVVLLGTVIGFWRKPHGSRVFVHAAIVSAVLASPTLVLGSLFGSAFAFVVTYPMALAAVAASAWLRRWWIRRSSPAVGS